VAKVERNGHYSSPRWTHSGCRITLYEAHGIGRKDIKRKRYLVKTMKNLKKSALIFVVCINNEDYLVSLELHKIYRVLPDEDAAVHGDLRIIDESGEDYLYSAERFVPISVPEAVQKSLLKAA